MPSILAGKYPINLSNAFTAGEFNWSDFETLKELKKQGYTTAMFTANIVTSSLKTNLNQFFDYFWDNLTEEELNRPAWLYQKAEVVLTAAKDFIKRNKKKNLLVIIHLMEAHGPYVPQIKSVFKGDELYRKDKRLIDRLVPTTFRGVSGKTLKKYKIMPKYQALMRGDDFERRVAEYITKYDMGIYLLDKQVGQFVSFLEREKLYDLSQLIITADHGELLGEENIFFSHGIFCHPVLALVPLIIKNPGQKKSQKKVNLVSLVDLLPTIAEGGELPPREVILNLHPKSLGIAWDKNYVVFHNGEFSDIETTQEDIFPVKSRGLEKIFKDYSRLSKDIWLRLFRRDGNSYTPQANNEHQKDLKVLFSLFLQWEQALISRIEKELLVPRRSERLGLKLIWFSLTGESIWQRIKEFGEYRYKKLVGRLKI